PRYASTVANIDSLEQAGVATYEKGYQNTGYFIQKYAPLKEFFGLGVGEPVLEWPTNYIEIRLADVYLLAAETFKRAGDDGKAQTYLDMVRNRVGLASVPATLDNIYMERRLELATEGHRWFDLIRTGKAATALAFKGFVAGKHEILPIPIGELNGTKLKQNPNY
ncbi:MAG TPA: RagB/SusD family nutrient uptake outer membrane protein, partial [Bacteroidales bacterium]|nr:RagB/SusD family nutrient uptake outer membrane protein [Bacteroidales bacterium]